MCNSAHRTQDFSQPSPECPLKCTTQGRDCGAEEPMLAEEPDIHNAIPRGGDTCSHELAVEELFEESLRSPVSHRLGSPKGSPSD
eukprot:693567-Amphidinium_carterae.2